RTRCSRRSSPPSAGLGPRGRRRASPGTPGPPCRRRGRGGARPRLRSASRAPSPTPGRAPCPSPPPRTPEARAARRGRRARAPRGPRRARAPPAPSAARPRRRRWSGSGGPRRRTVSWPRILLTVPRGSRPILRRIHGQSSGRPPVSAAPLRADEAERLAALRRYGILDTEPEPAFDDLTLVASIVCETPIAAITLVDEHRQWFKSIVGLPVRETSRDLSFCAHTIVEADLLVVPDVLADARFSTNPLVISEPRIRFYAGAPLVTPDGHALGTL